MDRQWGRPLDPRERQGTRDIVFLKTRQSWCISERWGQHLQQSVNMTYFSWIPQRGSTLHPFIRQKESWVNLGSLGIRPTLALGTAEGPVPANRRSEAAVWFVPRRSHSWSWIHGVDWWRHRSRRCRTWTGSEESRETSLSLQHQHIFFKGRDQGVPIHKKNRSSAWPWRVPPLLNTIRYY